MWLGGNCPLSHLVANQKYLGFWPTVITQEQDGEDDYLICGWDFLNKKKKKWVVMRCVDAHLENGKWYFSPGFIVKEDL
jgi:hypothetical protein